MKETIKAGKEAVTRQRDAIIRNLYSVIAGTYSKSGGNPYRSIRINITGTKSNIFNISSLKIFLKSFIMSADRFFICIKF
jgi:hypothetical protein